VRSITSREMEVDACCKFEPPSEVRRNNTVCSPILTAASVTSEAVSCRLVIGHSSFALFVARSIGWPWHLQVCQSMYSTLAQPLKRYKIVQRKNAYMIDII
jgi:hypothetical protein